jgi:Uma2 family endonuclease
MAAIAIVGPHQRKTSGPDRVSVPHDLLPIPREVPVYNRVMAVVYDSEPPRSVAGEPGPFRREDYFGLPDEPRCELVYGSLVVTPAPSRRHQQAVLALAFRLREYALARGHELLAAPADVALFEHTVLQPDILLVDRERRETTRSFVDGAPDLVVEVLSPSTGRRDRMVKLALYAKAGVPEYWIVDPEEQTIELLSLAGDAYRVVVSEEADAGRLRSLRFPELAIELDPFWDEVDRALTGRLPG